MSVFELSSCQNLSQIFSKFSLLIQIQLSFTLNSCSFNVIFILHFSVYLKAFSIKFFAMISKLLLCTFFSTLSNFIDSFNHLSLYFFSIIFTTDFTTWLTSLSVLFNSEPESNLLINTNSSNKLLIFQISDFTFSIHSLYFFALRE